MFENIQVSFTHSVSPSGEKIPLVRVKQGSNGELMLTVEQAKSLIAVLETKLAL